jgi:hypothetical protein
MRSLLRLSLAASLLLGACAPSTKQSAPVKQPEIVQPAPKQKIDRESVKSALAARRQVSYQRFLAYREAQVYPINSYTNGAQHVWLDELGNLCAAATIIAGDWGRDATARVAAENNFIALADVQAGPLRDWVLTSGLTLQEIVAIQVPPMGAMPEEIMQPDPQAMEIARLYNMYVDIERQLTGLWEENLEAATDALMARPELARDLLDGIAAGPGEYGAADTAVAVGFAQPPPV